jgi:tryptophan synthase alpha chain
LPTVLEGASGFIYYVAVLGVTGTRSAASDQVAAAIARIRRSSDLPIGVGFGIKDAPGAAAIARHADACVVGSALVERASDPASLHALVRELANAVRGARVQHSA